MRLRKWSVDAKIMGHNMISPFNEEDERKKEDTKKRKRERQKNKRKLNKLGKCKYCGCVIKNENRYIYSVCNKKECIGKLLEFCEEDCLNCKYPDCILYIGVVKRKEYFKEKGIPYTFNGDMRNKI